MSRRRVLTFGLLTAVLASGYGVMFTVLDDYRDEYGINETALGVIVGIGFFSSFLTQIFVAPIADRGHARNIVFGGVAVTVIGLFGMAFGTSLVPLLVGRFVMGLGIGAVFPAVRRIVILGDPENLGENLGLLLSADVAGFAAGPALSAIVVGPFGLSAPFLIIIAATLAIVPIIARIEVDEAVVDEDAPPAGLAFDLFRSRSFLAAACIGAAVFLMIGTFDALWAVVLDDLNARQIVANLGITFFALPLIFLGATGGRLAQRIGPFRLGPLGIILGAGFMFSYGVLPVPLLMLAVGIVHAISDGLTVSSAGVAAGLVVTPTRQASAQGLLGAVQTLTAAVTAVGAGVLYQHFDRVVAYGACALLMVVLAIAAYWLAGPEWRAKRGPDATTFSSPADLDTAVTGHA